MSQAAPGDSDTPSHGPSGSESRRAGPDRPDPSPLTDDELVEQLNDLLRRHAVQLGEHFSSVRIIATQLQADGTRKFQAGAGDYYAQRGAVRAWLVEEEMSRE